MFEKAIPQYHLSYTEEENRSMHEYLFSASESELVTALLELAEYYSDNEENKVKQALDDFALEIKLRYEMKQRYDKLRKCKEEWEQYLNNLQKYQEAKQIRSKYQQYKESAGSVVKGTSLFESFLGTEYIIKRGLYDREFIRRQKEWHQLSLRARKVLYHACRSSDRRTFKRDSFGKTWKRKFKILNNYFIKTRR